MNKLLPILLVVVMSGCGGEVKTSLENCTDDSMKFEFEFSTLDKSILNSSKEDFMSEYGNSSAVELIGYDAMLKIAKKNEEYIGFLDLSVQDKLQDRDYEKFFKKCERKRRNYPETFDAKWK